MPDSSAQSPQLCFGLIGASNVAATRVIPAMRRAGHSVAGVVSSSLQWGKEFAQRNELEWSSTQLNELLARDDIDAVYISTTNELHHQQVLASAAAGKHILCEKPLALTVEDGWEMVDACRGTHVVLAADHHLPAAGTHRAIQRLVQAGALGRVLAIRIFHAIELPERLRGWRLMEPQKGAGAILDITCHDAAAVNAILRVQPVEAVALAVRQGSWDAESEDAAMSVVRYEDDVLVQTHDAFTVPFAQIGLEVHGTEGSLLATDVMTQDPVGRIVHRSASGERVVEPEDRRDLYEVTLQAFASAVGGDGQPIVTGEDGVRALAVATAVLEAAVGGRSVPIQAQRDASGAGGTAASL
jgi:1,5-anhydro-D-fructose reductase (1,5-anhydro-D-mannitol-forming)